MTDQAVASESHAAEIVFPWWVLLVQGIAAVILGLLLFASPVITTAVLIKLLGWWWLIGGIFELGSLFVDRTAWGWKLASGLLSLFAGAYIVGNTLMGAAIVLATVTLLLGINGMIIGVVDIVRAFQGAGWGKGIIGVLSLLIGAAIAFNVTTFMTALPWVWGIFALAFGIAAIVGSFSAKKMQAA